MFASMKSRVRTHRTLIAFTTLLGSLILGLWVGCAPQSVDSTINKAPAAASGTATLLGHPELAGMVEAAVANATAPLHNRIMALEADRTSKGQDPNGPLSAKDLFNIVFGAGGLAAAGVAWAKAQAAAANASLANGKAEAAHDRLDDVPSAPPKTS